MKHVVFITGTSCVGKTSFANRIVDKMPADDVLCLNLTARKPRAVMGNPEWRDLMTNSSLSTWHQINIFDSFMAQLDGMIHHFKNSDHKVFISDRSILDVCGYSSAFKLDKRIMANHVKQYGELVVNKIKKDFHFTSVFSIADYSLGYDRDNNARPPEIVRVDCENYLNQFEYDEILTYGYEDQLIEKLISNFNGE